MPYNKDMEKAAIPSPDDIVREALRVVGRRRAAAAV